MYTIANRIEKPRYVHIYVNTVGHNDPGTVMGQYVDSLDSPHGYVDRLDSPHGYVDRRDGLHGYDNYDSEDENTNNDDLIP